MNRDPFAVPPDAVAVGTGRLTLDVIVRADARPRSQAGGTCGNVLADLAYLGWQAYPVTDIGDDDPGRRFVADLARFGVRTDLVRSLPGDETPVIIHHIDERDGRTHHSFSSRCPYCGRKLRYYEPPDEAGVRERLPAITMARACFFDRDSPGAFALARHAKEGGAMVVFEPNYAGPEVNMAEALSLCDVLKVSGEKLPGLVDRVGDGPRRLVETNGAAGLRYLDRRAGAEWVTLPAIPVPVVRDAGGSGDWCTAGLIHLAASGAPFEQALRFGQALGAWNCAFEGARGGMYAVSRERFRRDVQRLLDGERFDPAEGAHASTHDEAGAFCRGCGGRPTGASGDTMVTG